MSKPLKWAAVSVGAIVGIAHIGVLGHLIRLSHEPRVPVLPFPQINPTDATSFKIKASSDGYEVEYVGDDPKVMTNQVETDKSNGVFGVGGRTNVVRKRQFTRHGQGTVGSEADEGKLTAKELECIEAASGGRSSGALAGSSLVAGAAVPAITTIPYVGWLAAGWATLLGNDIGGKIGAGVTSIYKGC